MSVIKKVLANVVQSLLPSEQSQARSNIGIEPHTTPSSGMVVDTVSWTDKAGGDEWKSIRNPGVLQSLYVYGNKPTIVSVRLTGKAFGDFASLYGNIRVKVRLTNGADIFDSTYVEIPIHSSDAPGIQIPYNVIFMNAAPKVGNYWVEASCTTALSATEFVYLGGSGDGVVKSMSCL